MEKLARHISMNPCMGQGFSGSSGLGDDKKLNYPFWIVYEKMSDMKRLSPGKAYVFLDEHPNLN